MIAYVESTLADDRSRRYFIAGGAGFIGSHLVDALLADGSTEDVTLYDNFSSGREWHYEAHKTTLAPHSARGSADLTALTEAMAGHDVVVHLASNPDIARAVSEPEIDFQQGTYLTNNVVEAMRRSGNRLLYASGSGVYGDLGEQKSAKIMAP